MSSVCLQDPTLLLYMHRVIAAYMQFPEVIQCVLVAVKFIVGYIVCVCIKILYMSAFLVSVHLVSLCVISVGPCVCVVSAFWHFTRRLAIQTDFL